MPVHDDLGTRMKTYYEQIPKTKLMRRTPVIIRLDGCHFHTFTRGFQKPFDDILIKTMQETTKYLCENIQGCVLGYTQSDEITLVLVDYKNLNSSAWFDYEVQKMCSVASSMATMKFNKCFEKNFDNWGRITFDDWDYGGTNTPIDEINQIDWKQMESYSVALSSGAIFDARCFNVPKEEVTNCIYWRQLDATRNSVQMLGQAHFSHNKLQHKSCNDIKDMLLSEKGIIWDDLPTYKKHGSCIIRNYMISEPYGNRMAFDGQENEWIIDKNIPIFKDDGRKYIEKLINFD